MKNFLEYRRWFGDAKSKLRGRYPTFRIALNLLYQMPRHFIVETGSTCREDDYGAGNSTYIFGDFVERYGGKVVTIDNNPEVIASCKEVTAMFSDQIEYICKDSLEVLKDIQVPIDLLYLDSLDVPDGEDAHECQEQNLQELKLAEHALHRGSVVLLDDNNHVNGGKTKLTKQYLTSQGAILLMNYDQSLWLI